MTAKRPLFGSNSIPKSGWSYMVPPSPPTPGCWHNLGNFMRRLVLPEDMKHWTLTSLQTRLIKTGGRLVRHARRLVFQLAEVLVTREMLTGILERISRLRLAPG